MPQTLQKRSLVILFISIAFLFSNNSSYAQKKTITFWDIKRKETKKVEDAYIIRMVEEDPTTTPLLVFKENYISGEVYREGFVTSVKPLRFEGLLITYRKNGSKVSEINYKNGWPSGNINYYYNNKQLRKQVNYLESPKGAKYIPLEERTEVINYYDSLGNVIVNNGNGFLREGNDSLYTEGEYKNKLRSGIWKGTFRIYNPKRIVSYVEEYENGQLISGVTKDVDGEEFPYTIKETRPEYPEGMRALYKHIAESFIYPTEAIQSGVKGRLVIQFVVDHKGEITKTKVIESLGFGCDAEGLRIVKDMHKWKPGLQRGVPVSVLYNLPITLNLSKSPKSRSAFN